MARALRDYQATPVFSGYGLNLTLMPSTFGIGSSGAVNSSQTGVDVAPGCTLTLSATGVYTGTFPPCPKAMIVPSIQKSAAATVTEAILTAISPTAGTFTLRVSKAGTAAQPASGDLIGILLVAQPMGVT